MKDSPEAHARRRQADMFAIEKLTGGRHIDGLRNVWNEYEGRIQTFGNFKIRYQELRDEYYEKNPLGTIPEERNKPREYRQSAIHRANSTAELLAAINARLAQKKQKSKSSSKPKKELPTWYLTREGYDKNGNVADKTGFTGYEDSTRPEAGKTYNPRATEKLISRPNICAKNTKVWEEVLQNQLLQATEGTHQLDHEVFYGKPEQEKKLVSAFEQAAVNTERLYRRQYAQ